MKSLQGFLYTYNTHKYYTTRSHYVVLLMKTLDLILDQTQFRLLTGASRQSLLFSTQRRRTSMSCFSWLLLKSRLAYLAHSQLGQKPLFRAKYLSSVPAVGFADISASCFEQIDRSRISTFLRERVLGTNQGSLLPGSRSWIWTDRGINGQEREC